MNKYRLIKITDNRYQNEPDVRYVIQKQKRVLWWTWWSDNLGNFVELHYWFADESRARFVLEMFNSGKIFTREVIG
jgi:hypothetical protein